MEYATFCQVTFNLPPSSDSSRTNAAGLVVLPVGAELDQVLSAKVLRLANSPFYGFPSRQAWDLVGLDEQSLVECLAKASEEFQTIDDYL